MRSHLLLVCARLVLSASAFCFTVPVVRADVTLVQEGQARAAIHAPAEVLAMEDKNLANLKYPEREQEEFRVRLRA